MRLATAWPSAFAIALISSTSTTPVVCSSSWKSSLLALASDRIDHFYRDPANLDSPKEQDGVVFRLSKDDKICGGGAVPLTFVELNVDSVRPVDVFNVLADASSQSNWDKSCQSMVPLGDFRLKQARSFAGLFPAPPLASREAHEWQVVDANFSREEFWVIFSTLGNEELLQRKPVSPGAVELDNCLAAYKIAKAPGGVQVIMTQQINSHPWPLHARDVANLAWSTSVTWATSLRDAARKQAALGWVPNRTTVPTWMFGERPCTAPVAETSIRDSLMAKASAEFALPPSARGGKLQDRALPTGKELSIWRKDNVLCGGGDVAVLQVPLFQAEFEISGVSPTEVFNVLVAKQNESRWNKGFARAELLKFHEGARGIHEEFATASRLSIFSAPRELWEWQAAQHSFENGSYTLVLSSMPRASTDKFSPAHVEAHQCLAAYEVSLAQSGSKVRMTSHVNPHVWSALTRFDKVWDTVSENMIYAFASDLSTEAMRLAKQRRDSQGRCPMPDSGALRLLSPTPPDRNASVSVASVLEAQQRNWLLNFAELDVPQVLNTSGQEWSGVGNFERKATELHRLLVRLAYNATEAEKAVISAGVATDGIDVQQQGEVLAALQVRTIAKIASDICSTTGDLPDINHDGSEIGLPLWAEGMIAAALVLLLCGTCVGCCCSRRCKRSARQWRAADAALLSDAHQVRQRPAAPVV